jgi:glycosyltransferase involved in cell wall biosynthesis
VKALREPSEAARRPVLFITKLDAGGMERVCVALCNALARQGRDFLLYVSHAGGAMSGDVSEPARVCVAGRAARWAAPGLVRLCRRHAGSPLLIFSAEIGVVLMLLKRLRLISNPIIYRESTSVLSHCGAFWRWAIGRLVEGADGVIVQSPETLKDLQALASVRAPVEVVRNPCAWADDPLDDAFCPVPRAAGPLRLLIVGRLEPMKGHLRLLRALCRAGEAEWRLTVAGGGSLEPEIRQQVAALGLESRVELLGPVRDVRGAYAACDVVVIPSEYEGLPNVLVEALACGRRVLVCEGRGGTVEFLRELGLGDFVAGAREFDDALGACLRRVTASPQAVWLSARARMAEQVRPERVAEQVWSFLARCEQQG